MNYCKNGFTFIELIMIIVLVGVIFPLILAPFLQSAKETATPANISALTMVAKGNMEIEFDDFCSSAGQLQTGLVMGSVHAKKIFQPLVLLQIPMGFLIYQLQVTSTLQRSLKVNSTSLTLQHLSMIHTMTDSGEPQILTMAIW